MSLQQRLQSETTKLNNFIIDQLACIHVCTTVSCCNCRLYKFSLKTHACRRKQRMIFWTYLSKWSQSSVFVLCKPIKAAMVIASKTVGRSIHLFFLTLFSFIRCSPLVVTNALANIARHTIGKNKEDTGKFFYLGHFGVQFLKVIITHFLYPQFPFISVPPSI